MVTVGATVGLAAVDVKPLGDDVQEYVVPVTAAAPMATEPPPVQMDWLAAVAAAGCGLTVITTAFVLLQPVAVTVSVTE